MRRRRSFLASLGVVVLACLAGCSGSHPVEISPVTGRLMVGNKPAGGANVVFHAVDRRIVDRPVAVTERDGSFRLMTYALDDGAPAGDYIVTIFWRDESMPIDGCEGRNLVKHDRFYGLYFDSRYSPLRATVRPGPNEIAIQAINPDDFLNLAQAPRPTEPHVAIKRSVSERRPARI